MEDDGGDSSSSGSSSDNRGFSADAARYSHRHGHRAAPAAGETQLSRPRAALKNKTRAQNDATAAAASTRKPSTGSRAKGVAISGATSSSASKPLRPVHRDSLGARKATPQSKAARVSGGSNSAMARDREHHAAQRPSGRVASYGALSAEKMAAARQQPKEADTTWKSHVDKWRHDVGGGVLSPRGKASRMGFSDQSAEDTDSDSTSSTSSSIRSLGSPPSPGISRKLVPSAATTKAVRAVERTPLLRAHQVQQQKASVQQDLELGADVSLDSEPLPSTRKELLKICRLSYPVIFTYLLEFFPSIISLTLVGHMDSPMTKQYVDGVSLSSMVMNLTGVAFGFGLATAMDTLCSQAFGAGKPRLLGVYFQSGVIVLGLTVVPVWVLNWFTSDFLIWMDQPRDVAILAGQFTQIQLIGIPFLYVYELFKKLLQAQNIMTPMVYIAVLSNVVNLVLGFYLTFYTPLGFVGAAIARTVSNIVLPLALIPYLVWNPDALHAWWPGWHLKEAISHIRPFLELGIPGMFMMLLEWWSFEIMAVFVGLLPNSVVAISVHSVLVNVSTMAFNVFLGISVATNVLVGNYVGANQPQHAKLASNLGMTLSTSISAVLVVVIVALRGLLPEVFINDDTSVALAAHALLFLMPYQMCDSINCVMQGVFRGTGRQTLGALLNLFSYFVIGLPFGLYLAFPVGWGVEGMWLGLTAGIAFGCVVSFVKIYQTNWMATADAAIASAC